MRSELRGNSRGANPTYPAELVAGRFAHLLPALLLVVGLGTTACTYLHPASSDEELQEHLHLVLAAAPDTATKGGVSFGLYFASKDGSTIWPGGRAIEFWVNGKQIEPPREFAWGECHDKVAKGTNWWYWRGSYWRKESPALSQWLGPGGEFSLEARVGPVSSNAVRLRMDRAGNIEVVESPPMS